MALTITSSRFGQVEIDPDTVVEFPEGLIGLGGSRFALLARDQRSPFLWLQSLEDPELALPVTDPKEFFSEFRMELDDEDAARLGLDATTAVAVYVTVRAAPAPEDCTANLKAPILVWSGIAHQVINQAPAAVLRAPLFPAAGATQALSPRPIRRC
jgi:flagellar assembly factor FliW